MRKSSELLRAIRVEVFEETQEKFGKRLQVNNETISRLVTPAQVNDGLCDSLRLYEPSEGWCRAHHAGYKPVFGTRRRNSAVEQ